MKNLFNQIERIHYEALLISFLSLTGMIGAITWSYINYNDNTSNSFLITKGRTVPIFDNTKSIRSQHIKVHYNNTK